MKKQTSLANSIEITDLKAQYDNCCKHLLSYKAILAHILCSVVDEFSDMDWRDAVPYIETPTIGEASVDANTPDRIHGEQTEDTTVTDGERRFDILFRAKLPDKDEVIELIINIEVQNDFAPGYSLLKRGIYYCSRLISRQLGTEFARSDYDKIKKVYSIWICTNSAKDYANTISTYEINRRVKHGELPDTTDIRKEYDLLSLNMICIGSSDDKKFTGIIELLGVLLSDTLPVTEKKNIMSGKFDLPMTETVDEEVERMCNLSSAIEERGIKRGFERGDKQGFERGNKQGFERGNKQGFERGNKQGFERGDKQGFERGTRQTKKDIVFELKNMLSIEEIAKVTKLPVEDVKKILSEKHNQS